MWVKYGNMNARTCLIQRSIATVARTGLAALGLTIGLAALLGWSALAQSEPVELARWAVEVWPEHDRPAVLVIVSGEVGASSSPTQTLRIPLPAQAEVNAVAFPNEEGRLISLAWETETTEAGQEIVFDTANPEFVVEYYLDVISPPPDRSFDLELVAPYPAEQASVTLRQPARASDMETVPAMQPAGVDSLGNALYTLDLGALAAGQAAPLRVSYTKADNNPTVANAVAAADAPEDAGAPAAADNDWLLPAGLALGFIVVAGIGVVYWRSRRPAGATRQARRRQARAKGGSLERGAAGPAAKTAQNTFCPQCGAKFEAADKFCRNCGAARR
jgi:hypothetical protein